MFAAFDGSEDLVGSQRASARWHPAAEGSLCPGECLMFKGSLRYTLTVRGLMALGDLQKVLSPPPWRRRLVGFGLIGFAFALALLLRALPYSSCRLTAVSAAEVGRRPTPDFTLGPLTWRVAEWKEAQALNVFRKSLRADCGWATGVKAATCAAAALARRSPLGRPSSEFIDREFDPVRHFERHMAGEPGHCLTRSAIIATQLLAVGIPARVVQIVPSQGRGHTVVEVWDEALGWTVIDPTSGGIVTSHSSRRSAADLLDAPASVQWTPIPSATFAATTARERQRYYQSVLQGNLVYPEPWLYLRLGERVAPKPFRGHFVRVGPESLALGPAQVVLVWLIPCLGLAGLAVIAIGRMRPAIRADVVRERHVLRGAPALGDPGAVPPI